MSNKHRVVKQRFRSACSEAVPHVLGKDWIEVSTLPESWEVYFASPSGFVERKLYLRLTPKSHLIELTLEARLHGDRSIATTWWEDRNKHARKDCYRKVIWEGTALYSAEAWIKVPKLPITEEYVEAIKQKLQEYRETVLAWFLEAESYIGENRS